MFHMKSRKGITPVIAIVLLLMVTVGAVGVVYTQFQSLLGDPGAATQEQQQVRDTEMTFSSVYNDGSDNLMVEVRNTGDVSWNTSDFTMQFIPGGEGTPVSLDVATNAGFTATQSEMNCFSADTDANSEVIDPEESYSCDTGFEFPGSNEALGIIVQMNGASKDWSYTCSVSSGDAYGC
jgi:flagellin-like protein